MKIRIATWNMAYWSHKGLVNEAWDYLINKIDADIFLVQESRPPKSIQNIIWKEIGGKRDWGSGIYSKIYKLQEIDILRDHDGTYTVAEADLDEGQTLKLVSMYGLFEKLGKNTYLTPNNHRMLSDLTGLFKGHIGGNKNIVIGGDLNESIQFDEKFGIQDSKILFDRIKNFDLIDCFEPFFDDFVQTLRHHQSDKPWQNDYFFISKRMKKKLINCEVLDNEEIRKFSDHNPVIITLDI